MFTASVPHPTVSGTLSLTLPRSTSPFASRRCPPSAVASSSIRCDHLLHRPPYPLLSPLPAPPAACPLAQRDTVSLLTGHVVYTHSTWPTLRLFALLLIPQHLPLRIETLSAIRRKEDLERRLKEIEDAQKIFSRPKVLVHL